MTSPYTDTPQPKKKKGGCLKWGAIIVAVFIVLGIIVQATGGDSDTSSPAGTDAITDTTEPGTDTTDEVTAPEVGQVEDVPAEYKSALRKAKTYVETMHMSKRGVYDQLTSEYGEKFAPEAAQYAVDNLDADYNAAALEKAKTYQESMSMSPAAIYDQLISEYGEKFTPEEAQYAVDNLNP